MHLESGQALDEGIDCICRHLFPLVENYVHAFEEGDEVFIFDREGQGSLIHALYYGVECRYKVFLVDVEGLPGSHFDYLEGTEQASQYIGDTVSRGIRGCTIV